MATTRSVATTQTSAVTNPEITDEELTVLLRLSGDVAPASMPTIPRIKIDGSMFIAGDEIYPYNPATKQPAFLGRIVNPVIEYQGLWFTPEMADAVQRPDISERFCKSYFANPEQARKFAEDGYSCQACAFGPFLKETLDGINKCKWKGDLEIQIIPESGQLTGEETIWTLTLSTTGIIEYKGTSRDAVHGSTIDPTSKALNYNFMHKLARFGSQDTPDDPQKGALQALTAYRTGGVVAAFRLLPASNASGSITWRTVSLEPIAVIPADDTPALAASTDPDEGSQIVGADAESYTDLPF